jgi:hypothetical protein
MGLATAAATWVPSLNEAGREPLLFTSLIAVAGAAWFLLIQAAILKRLSIYWIAVHVRGLI